MRYKRETLQDMTRPLKQWLYKNKNNPYPTKGQKVELAEQSKMTLTQVSNWFANARRRLKNTVRGNELSWERRVSMYNDCVKGNQQSMDISDDSAWESGDEADVGRDMQSPHESTEMPAAPSTEPTSTVTQPTENKMDPQIASFSRQIESALRKELTSTQPTAPQLNIPNLPIPTQSAESCNNVTGIKCEPVEHIKQEPLSDNSTLTGSQLSVCSSTVKPGASSDMTTKVTPNMSSVNLPNPISSYSYQPIKSEPAPPVSQSTNDTIVSNITNQIAAYLMASTMAPFGIGQFPVLTPQMQEEARQHIALMQAHVLEQSQNCSSANSTHASTTVNTTTATAPTTFPPHPFAQPSLPITTTTTSQQQNTAASMLSPKLSSMSQTVTPVAATLSQASEAFSTTPSPNQLLAPGRRLSQNCSTSDSGMDSSCDVTRELIPSPAQSEGDLCYPKSDTPKYKSTLLQRYLQGDSDGRLGYGERPADERTPHVLATTHVPTSTPLSSPSHPYQGFSPLDLRKRVRNLSGSMGSQEYEDISECDASDVASSGLTSPGFAQSRDSEVANGGNVFDDLVKRWQQVNQGAPLTKQDEEKDELMMKEVSAIFTLANLASSRTNPAPQS